MDYLGTIPATANRVAKYGELRYFDIASINAVSAAINTTETILMSGIIAANMLIVGSVFQITVYGTCTSTVANTSNLRVRLGTAGTVADVVVAVITPTAAAAGTAVPFCARFTIVIRTVGSAGTMAGSGQLLNNGVTGLSAAAVVIGTPTSAVAVNTTVQNSIELTYQAAATTTTSTFQTGIIELIK